MTALMIQNEDDQPQPKAEYPPDTHVVMETIHMTPVVKKDNGKLTFHYQSTIPVARGTLMVQVGDERGHSIWKLLTELKGFQYYALSYRNVGIIRPRSRLTNKKYNVVIQFFYDAANREVANDIATEIAFMGSTVGIIDYDLGPVREREAE